MDSSDKRGNFILALQGHHSYMALENTIVVATNADQYSQKNSNHNPPNLRIRVLMKLYLMTAYKLQHILMLRAIAFWNLNFQCPFSNGP